METAYIGMGANLPSMAGPPEATLAAAADQLGGLGRVTARSSLYSTAPVGFAEQPRFVNAVIALETGLNPRALLDGLLAIESQFGRDRTTGLANGPRTLDLDILLYGGMTMSEPGLEIPHPRWTERGFVLFPLYEIAPTIRDPRTGLTVAQWIQRKFPRRAGSIHQAVPVQHEIVPVQSDLWRVGVGGGDAAGHDVERPDSRPPHGDRGR